MKRDGISISLEIDKKLLKAFREAMIKKTDAMMEEANKALKKVATIGEAFYVQYVSTMNTDTGQVIQSSFGRLIDDLTAAWGSSAAHAIYLEFGTKPHRPPFKPIYEWVWRKRKDFHIDDEDVWIVAKSVCDKIARVGTKETLHLTNSVKDVEQDFKQLITNAVRRALRSE